MKFQSRWMRRLAGFSAALFTRAWMSPVNFKGAYYDEAADPINESFQGPVIFLFWHEYLLAPFYGRGHTNTAILSSTHSDAEWIVEAGKFMGYSSIRGSTRKQASKALLEMAQVLKTTNVAVTPDGPRGPRRTMSQGPIFLSSRLGVPLVPLGFGYDRAWRMNTWDRFVLPHPLSRCRGVIGPRVHIPPDLDRDGIEHYRLRMERLLTRLTVESEAWAASATSKIGEVASGRQPAPLKLRPLPSRFGDAELSAAKNVLPKAA